MTLPITTPEIITHLTGLKNGFDFHCSHIDSTRKLDGELNNSDVYISDWYSDVDQPTDAEILAAQDEVESLIKSQEYIEKRKVEYPSIVDVTVALAEKTEGDSTMWDEITVKRAAVKTKWPKDNSGPVE